MLKVQSKVSFLLVQMAVVFRDRNHKRTQQFQSQATFGTGSGELPFSDVITTLDDSKVLNIISVTRDGGFEQLQSNDESIAKLEQDKTH